MKVSRLLLLSSCIIVLTYIFISVWISLSVNGVIKKTYNSHGLNYTKNIPASQEVYQRMNYRANPKDYYGEIDYSDRIIERNSRSFPITFHWFIGGITYYKYSYELVDKETGILSGSDNALVTIKVKFNNFKWFIKEYQEEP